jgi:hypothetical protein
MMMMMMNNNNHNNNKMMMAIITIVQWDPTKIHRIFMTFGGFQPMQETGKRPENSPRRAEFCQIFLLRAQFLSRLSSYCLGCSL